jgi:hypothetical protein
MGNDSQNRWIVLINKSPKGPLGADEINALIAQGIVKRNDAAFLVGGKKTEWKFLWQFAEFDRRKLDENAKKPAAPPKPVVETGGERRTVPQMDVLDLLPSEIASIRPEDLVSRAKPYIPEVPEEFTRGPAFKTGRTISINFGIALFFFVIVIYQVFKSDDKPKPREIANTPPKVESQMGTPETPSHMPLDSSAMPKSRPLEKLEKKNPWAGRKGGAPSTRDSGEIPQADFDRRQEEKLEKSRYDEDDRDQPELSDEEMAEEELPKKSKRRRVPTTEEEEPPPEWLGETDKPAEE